MVRHLLSICWRHEWVPRGLIYIILPATWRWQELKQFRVWRAGWVIGNITSMRVKSATRRETSPSLGLAYKHSETWMESLKQINDYYTFREIMHLLSTDLRFKTWVTRHQLHTDENLHVSKRETVVITGLLLRGAAFCEGTHRPQRPPVLATQEGLHRTMAELGHIPQYSAAFSGGLLSVSGCAQLAISVLSPSLPLPVCPLLLKGGEPPVLTCKSWPGLTLRMELSCLVFLVL